MALRPKSLSCMAFARKLPWCVDNGPQHAEPWGPFWGPLPTQKQAAEAGSLFAVSRRITITSRAGDRTRTGDVQLGKLAFYQLNYARVARNLPRPFPSLKQTAAPPRVLPSGDQRFCRRKRSSANVVHSPRAFRCRMTVDHSLLAASKAKVFTNGPSGYSNTKRIPFTTRVP